MTPVVTLVEHAPARSFRLPDAAGRALVASRILEEAGPDPYEPGAWRLRAGSKVGAVALAVPGAESITVHITPKVPVARLLFLVGYSSNPRGWRDGSVDLADQDELLPALAHAVERQIDRALRQGLLQGYRTTEESSHVMRGRLREAEQIRHRFGMPLPVEVVFDEFTTDIAENRLLCAAVDRLLRLPGVPGAVRARLMHQRSRLADITPLVSGQAPPCWQPTRLNARYHSALHLAEAVLQGSSTEHLPGRLRMDGFLFDMNGVYEDFICKALREAMRTYGGRSALQARNIHMDEGESIRLRPDFVWYGDSGVPTIVADAKYKARRNRGFPNEDFYQMLAYCTALGLPEGHLVYAKGNTPHISHRVRHAGTVLHQHAIDLDQQSAGLLAEIDALARHMLHGAAMSPQGGAPSGRS
ncbi:McrC family protein [Streptomyces durocortorensis]|uniref:Restriction endonuclease n=1 Tax=Streptomyces durocortorensis TaxID=2811104 RepID=A0ABS2I3N9_9ACTN|nr:restriction endonuclease [Streptomyces durocortorensis]MBM7057821.1 restriction endonuclease [Streptomyces durocortorensis]